MRGAPPLPDILPMRPYFREMIWGGRALQTLYGKNLPPEKKIGESFELSACPGQESFVSEGPLAGWDIRQLSKAFQGDLLGEKVWRRYSDDFPILIKLIDAREDLSIQVHPNDRYALENDLGQQGKNEAWYILHSDAGRVAYGLKDGVERNDFEAAIRERRVEEVVGFFDVKPGDVIINPPGTVHAIGRGVILYEIQQSSDLTFRIYDYDRPGTDGKPRELHIREALEVITFGTRISGPTPWNMLPGSDPEKTILVETEDFRLERRSPSESETLHDSGDSFAILTVVEGETEVQARTGSYFANKGQTIMIPAGRKFTVTRKGRENLEYLLATLP